MVNTNKTTIILIIRALSPIKNHQKVIKQQPDPSHNAIKANDICLIPGNDEMVEHIIPINKSGLQEIFTLKRK